MLRKNIRTKLRHVQNSKIFQKRLTQTANWYYLHNFHVQQSNSTFKVQPIVYSNTLHTEMKSFNRKIKMSKSFFKLLYVRFALKKFKGKVGISVHTFFSIDPAVVYNDGSSQSSIWHHKDAEVTLHFAFPQKKNNQKN